MHVSLINEHGIITSKTADPPARGQYPTWLERVGWALVAALGLNAAVGVALLAVLLQGVG